MKGPDREEETKDQKPQQQLVSPRETCYSKIDKRVEDANKMDIYDFCEDDSAVYLNKKSVSDTMDCKAEDKCTGVKYEPESQYTDRVVKTNHDCQFIDNDSKFDVRCQLRDNGVKGDEVKLEANHGFSQNGVNQDQVPQYGDDHSANHQIGYNGLKYEADRQLSIKRVNESRFNGTAKDGSSHHFLSIYGPSHQFGNNEVNHDSGTQFSRDHQFPVDPMQSDKIHCPQCNVMFLSPYSLWDHYSKCSELTENIQEYSDPVADPKTKMPRGDNTPMDSEVDKIEAMLYGPLINMAFDDIDIVDNMTSWFKQVFLIAIEEYINQFEGNSVPKFEMERVLKVIEALIYKKQILMVYITKRYNEDQ